MSPAGRPAPESFWEAREGKLRRSLHSDEFSVRVGHRSFARPFGSLRLLFGISLVTLSLAVVGFPSRATAGVTEVPWLDSCGMTPNTSHLQTWWNNEGFYWGLGVYIRGPCFIPSPSWTSAVQQQGWGLMAIWDNGGTCSSINSKGFSDGVRDAGGNSQYGQNSPNTKADLANAGFSSNATVAIDIEGTGCNSNAAQYMSGWVWQMGNNGAATVVYGSSSGSILALTQNLGSIHPPQNIWWACYTSLANYAYTGNGSDCPGNYAFNSPGTSNGSWVHDQRHHQWLSNLEGGQPGHYECYGGYQLEIDSDEGLGFISFHQYAGNDSETNDGPTEDSGDRSSPQSWDPTISDNPIPGCTNA